MTPNVVHVGRKVPWPSAVPAVRSLMREKLTRMVQLAMTDAAAVDVLPEHHRGSRPPSADRRSSRRWPKGSLVTERISTIQMGTFTEG